MSDDFIITPRDNEMVQLTIRIEKRIQDGFDKLASESGRSRNDLINTALSFSLERAQIMLPKKDIE